MLIECEEEKELRRTTNNNTLNPYTYAPSHAALAQREDREIKDVEHKLFGWQEAGETIRRENNID